MAEIYCLYGANAVRLIEETDLLAIGLTAERDAIAIEQVRSLRQELAKQSLEDRAKWIAQAAPRANLMVIMKHDTEAQRWIAPTLLAALRKELVPLLASEAWVDVVASEVELMDGPVPTYGRRFIRQKRGESVDDLMKRMFDRKQRDFA